MARFRHIEVKSTLPEGQDEDNVRGDGEFSAPVNKVASVTVPLFKRQDFRAWFGSIVLFVGLAGAIFGIGVAKGWQAPSGFSHDDSVTSQQRFLPEPYVPEPGIKGRYGPGAAGRWYYWRLKPDLVKVYNKLFVWSSYVCHQVFVWTTIYLAQKEKLNIKGGVSRYGTHLAWFNWLGLGGNIGFHLLHLLNTHITYDALAADVTVSSSQCSVIMLIIYIFIIEYRDRGYAFGWPSSYDTGSMSEKAKLPYGPMYIVRKYHGYAFSWGAIYTFWYHPMENTWGHVLGFFHTFAILLQGSLIFTKIHLNKYWRFLLETWVALHGSIVAMQTGGEELNGTSLWPLFCFGFLLMVAVSQIFTLPVWRKIPTWLRPFPAIILLVIIVWCYSWIPNKQGRYFVRMYEIVFIPALLLTAPLLVWGLLHVYIKVEDKCKPKDIDKDESKKLKIVKSVSYFVLSCFVLSFCSLIGFLTHYFDVQIRLQTMMPILSIGYCVIVSVQLMLAKQMFPGAAVGPVAKVAPDRNVTAAGAT